MPWDTSGARPTIIPRTGIFVATLDEETPDTEEKDALANYIMYGYVKRHIEFMK